MSMDNETKTEKKEVYVEAMVKTVNFMTNPLGFAQPIFKFTKFVTDKVNRQKFDAILIPETKIVGNFEYGKGSLIKLQLSPDINFSGYVNKGEELHLSETKCKCGAPYLTVKDMLFCSGAMCPYKSSTNLIRFLLFVSKYLSPDDRGLSLDDVNYYITHVIANTNGENTVVVNNLDSYFNIMKSITCDIAPRLDAIFKFYKARGEKFCQDILDFEIKFQKFMRSDDKYIIFKPGIFWSLFKFPYIEEDDVLTLARIFKSIDVFVEDKKIKKMHQLIEQISSTKIRTVLINNHRYIKALAIGVMNYDSDNQASTDQAITKN